MLFEDCALKELSRSPMERNIFDKRYNVAELSHDIDREFNRARPVLIGEADDARPDDHTMEEVSLLYNLRGAFFRTFGVWYDVLYFPFSRVFSSNAHLQEMANRAAEYVRIYISSRPDAAI